MPNKFERIFIHCSDSEWGDAFEIDRWHKEKGFDKIGYHLVVSNGYPTAPWWNAKVKVPYLEGAAQIGRAIDPDDIFDSDEQGAHCYGFNKGSFAICMIGKMSFTHAVLNSTLTVVRYHLAQFGITPEMVFGHYEFDSKKTCPNIDMDEFRLMLKTGKFYGQKTISTPKVESQPPVKELNLGEILKKIFSKIKAGL